MSLASRADRVFSAALDLAPEKVEAFVEEACGDDAALRELVEKLLVEASREDTLLMSSAQRNALWDGLLEHLSKGGETAEGTVVGRYRIVRELGRGGMAVVYLAERADGEFEQQAAVKRIQRGIATPEGIQRFELERSILARIHHPHIAQLLDGGVDAEGRPYLVMEYIEGRPIDQYCDEERLPVGERLELFLQAARAVEAAHRNLVIHRDLKPSNILVTDDGYAKLLDFGIAKLAAEGAGGTDLTRDDARVMTPVFASPEQVRGEAVTTASDVYQLGLLLYLLLSGRWPFRLGDGQPAQVIQAICEDEPARPSTVIGTTGVFEPPSGLPVSPREVGAARASSPPRLKRLLSGDLDNIALMALRKEPERRYGSVAQLIDDVEAYLEGRAVAARGDSLLYRAGKLARRHRAAVAVAAAALVLLAALAVFYTARLARERDRARIAAAEATQVSGFLRGLFEISAPTRSKGEQVTAREMLDRGALRVEAELAEQPRLQADMMTLMGDVYRELALYDESAPLLAKAVELRRRLPGDGGLDLAESLLARGHLAEEQGELDRARQLTSEALALREAALGPRHPDVARALLALGRVDELQGEFDSARTHLERALAVLEGALGPDDPEVGLTLRTLGEVLKEVREVEAARGRLTRAVEVLSESYDPDHPHLVGARVLLGDVLRMSGDGEGSRAQYETALPLVERVYGAGHPEAAVVLNKLGNLLNAMGDFEGAVAAHEPALRLREAAFGPEHPLVASSLNNLGKVYLTVARYDEARVLLERSAEVYEATLGPDHADVAVPNLNLAHLAQETEDWERADERYSRVLEIRRKAYGESSSFLTQVLLNLGIVKIQLGQFEEAEPLLRKAIEVGRKEKAHRHPENLWPRIELGRCLTALRRFSEAERILLGVRGEEDVDKAMSRRCLEALIALYEAWGKAAEADREREALDELERAS